MKRLRGVKKLAVAALLLWGASSCENMNPAGGNEQYGQVTDIDGNTYRTVKIGEQEWTVENLRTTRYNDGTQIMYISENENWKQESHDSCIPAYSYYRNMAASEDSIKNYGALYNWYAVNTGKLAPEGWHVPTDEEWMVLEEYLIANGYNYDSTKTSDKTAKALAATKDWKEDEIPGTIGNDISKNNRSGFNALPGGGIYPDGGCYGLGLDGNWWTDTREGKTYVLYYCLSYERVGIEKYINLKSAGFSIRLIKD